MAEKEHFRLSTVSRTTSFPVTPGTLYLGFQTSSWQKDHYWGKFRLTFGIDSKKTFSPLAKVTFVGLWLHLLGENYNERKWSSHSSHTSLPIDSFVSFRGSPLSQGIRCPFFPGNPCLKLQSESSKNKYWHESKPSNKTMVPFSFARRVVFLPLAIWIPNPPSFFGFCDFLPTHPMHLLGWLKWSL